MSQVTKCLTIQGNVQGVGYRYSFQRIAQKNGVTGWVRNKRDGSVEAVVQGEDKAVAAVIEWARQGPALAQVDQVAVADGSGTYFDFSIQETN